MSTNRVVAQRFIAALEARDAARIEDLLTNDVVEVLPFAADGGARPAAVFERRDEVMRVQRVIVDSFERISFDDQRWTESGDGLTVFLEARGERLHADRQQWYRNEYVLKFEFRDGRIQRVTEYSNPVAFATFFGLRVGAAPDGEPTR